MTAGGAVKRCIRSAGKAMDRRNLLEIIARIDMGLASRQNDAVFDSEGKGEIGTARALLAKLKNGVLRGDDQIQLGEVWPLSTIGLILPAICAVETQGTPVQYESVTEDLTEVFHAEPGTEISHLLDVERAGATPDETKHDIQTWRLDHRLI